MKRLVANYYLFVMLGLIAQALFVVFSGNVSIASNLQLKKLQAENDAIDVRISLLQDQISSNNSSYNLTSQTEFTDYAPIADRTVVHSQSVASLP